MSIFPILKDSLSLTSCLTLKSGQPTLKNKMLHPIVKIIIKKTNSYNFRTPV